MNSDSAHTATAQLGPWPYPRWIAHRGAGKLAPENTLAAFRLGAQLGFRAFECDVKLSADEVPFLLHDATLDRTVASNQPPSTIAGTLPWADLSRLDAGRWHSGPYAGEPIASLTAVAAFALCNRHALNLEIKPTPGLGARTGTVVARHAHALWQEAMQSGQQAWPLLSSFDPSALEAARTAAPQLPRALLLDSLPPDYRQVALDLGCTGIVLNYRLIDAELIRELHCLGLRVLTYTVNTAATAQALLSWDIDGIITDAVDQLPSNLGAAGATHGA